MPLAWHRTTRTAHPSMDDNVFNPESTSVTTIHLTDVSHNVIVRKPKVVTDIRTGLTGFRITKNEYTNTAQ